MTLSRGRDLLAIPGPSIIPDRVLNAMHRPAPNIYEGELIELTDAVIADLQAGRAHRRRGGDLHRQRPRRLGGGDRQHPARPATRRWCIATGRFGLGWAADGAADGRRGRGDGLRLPRRARPGPGRRRGCAPTAAHEIRAVLAVQTDTASSVRNDVAALRARARRRRPSGAPRRRLHRLPRLRPLRDGRLGRRRDGRRLPEGADDAARPRLHLPRAAGRGGAGRAAPAPTGTGGRARAPSAYYQLFCGTAPTHHLYGLRCALDMILTRRGWSRSGRGTRSSPGRSGRRSRPGARAARWRSTSPTPALRSHAVTTIRTGPATARGCGAGARTRPGVTLGIGLERARASTPTASSASATWAISTRRCCSARWRRSRRGSRGLGIRARAGRDRGGGGGDRRRRRTRAAGGERCGNRRGNRLGVRGSGTSSTGRAPMIARTAEGREAGHAPAQRPRRQRDRADDRHRCRRPDRVRMIKEGKMKRPLIACATALALAAAAALAQEQGMALPPLDTNGDGAVDRAEFDAYVSTTFTDDGRQRRRLCHRGRERGRTCRPTSTRAPTPTATTA